MKVVLWGSYNHGNFGDDIMAIIFARHLRRIGCEVVVYRLNDMLARSYDLSSIYELAEALDGAAAVVIGGGAMWKNRQWLRSVVRPHARRIEHDFFDLHWQTSRLGIPIYAASIGSDGAADVGSISPERRRLFASAQCTGATVRLPGDLELAKSFKIKAAYFPDILLDVSRLWCGATASVGTTSRPDGVKNVGVNLPKKWRGVAERLIQIVRRRDSGVVLHFISSHLEDSGHHYEYLPSAVDQSVKVHRYRDPSNTLDFLGSMDMIISFKLHLGICAASYGVAFISFGAHGKTRAQMELLGLSEWVFSRAEEDGLCAIVENAEAVDTVLRRYKTSEIAKAATEASAHLSGVTSFVDGLR